MDIFLFKYFEVSTYSTKIDFYNEKLSLVSKTCKTNIKDIYHRSQEELPDYINHFMTSILYPEINPDLSLVYYMT